MPPHASRRAFLFGRSPEPAATCAPVASVTRACLALRGVACMSCRDACPTGAMRFELARGGARPLVETESCTGCGDCAAVCPAGAIAIEAARA